MARTDIAGLLTGIGQSPIDPMVGLTYEQRALARGAQASRGLRRSVGALTGADTRTTQEKAQDALAQLDPSKREDREKILQIVSRVNPERVPALREEFTRRDKQQAQAEAAMTSSTQTRAAVARQLQAEYPDLAKAIIAERASGSEEALKTGLDILKERAKPQAGDKDPALVAEYKFAQSQGYKGTFQDYIQSKKSPLVSTAPTPEQVTLEAALTRQGNMVEATAEAAESAVVKLQNANKILNTVDRGIATGVVPEFLANQSAVLQGALEAVGLKVPEPLKEGVYNQSELKKIQVDGMLPFIQEQGRGWTDADRENYFRTSAGYTQPWQYNEIVALTDKQNAITALEKNQFANSRANLTTVTDLTGNTLWADYTKKLGRTKVVDAERGGFKYQRPEVIDDGANLSQYWVEDIPRGFVLPDANGNEVELSWPDLYATAKKNGVTARELLAHAQLSGNLLRAVY